MPTHPHLLFFYFTAQVPGCVVTVQPSLFIIRRFGLFGAVQHDMSFKAPHCFRALRPRAVPPSYGVYLWEHDRRRLGGILRERLCRARPQKLNSPAGKVVLRIILLMAHSIQD